MLPRAQAVACDEAGTPVWRLGTLRAVLTRHRAAPCLDLEFLGAKEGKSPAFRQLLPRGWRLGATAADKKVKM